MRMIRCNPQPEPLGNDRYLLRPERPQPGYIDGGLYFSWPVYSIAWETFGEYVPFKGGSFGHNDMELLPIDGVWYWVE